MSKIIICTTFREFRNNSNDAIQKNFLNSLENQSESDFELVVTTFGEKNVKKVVKQHALKSTFFDNFNNKYRFSSTDVLYNGIKRIKKDTEILIWTTCDILLPTNFITTLLNSKLTNTCFSSTPHNIIENGKKSFKFISGLDFVGFDSDFLSKKAVTEEIKEIKFNNWGGYEFFLTALAEKHHQKFQNLWPEIEISKIENDREMTNESYQYMMTNLVTNQSLLYKFLSDNKIHYFFPLGLFFILKLKPKKRVVYYYFSTCIHYLIFVTKEIISMLFLKINKNQRQ